MSTIQGSVEKFQETGTKEDIKITGSLVWEFCCKAKSMEKLSLNNSTTIAVLKENNRVEISIRCVSECLKILILG